MRTEVTLIHKCDTWARYHSGVLSVLIHRSQANSHQSGEDKQTAPRRRRTEERSSPVRRRLKPRSPPRSSCSCFSAPWPSVDGDSDPLARYPHTTEKHPLVKQRRYRRCPRGGAGATERWETLNGHCSRLWRQEVFVFIVDHPLIHCREKLSQNDGVFTNNAGLNSLNMKIITGDKIIHYTKLQNNQLWSKINWGSLNIQTFSI